MDKQQAQTIIKETFEKSFNKDRFNGFIKNLLNQIEDAPFSYQGNYIPDAYKPFISRYERIGKYNDGQKRIDILIVYLNRKTSIERARTSQRNFIAGYLDGKYGSDVSKDAALVAFVSPNEEDWRFSLVKMDYRFEQAKNGKVKVKEEFTPARRWSFLVGKNESSHTAQSRLVPRLADDENNPTLAQMEEAFNIERVTKEFFEKYRELFLWTKETLDKIVERDTKIEADFEAKDVNTIDFAKKLLGQIVFLYFLQKKGWFGVKRDAEWGTGAKQFLRELFQGKHRKYGNFFNDILEPLFYDALSRDRSDIDHWNDQFRCKIPLLNGGLFDPIGNYSWYNTDILLPNELFSNQNKTKEGDIGNGILDIFDRYNFTVKEDEPLEKEVAVDPEMLGKVFENLLEVKDRKSKGTYYTPREIVHYMCQQSLINYLNTELKKGFTLYQDIGDIQTNAFGNEAKVGQLDLTVKHKSGPEITKKDIETLIKYSEQFGENEATVEARGKETGTYSYKLSESIRRNAKLIDGKLANIKVCDPAIGSGVFPVGMMHEIVKTRNVLSAYINDPSRTIYQFKRECIEKSLYGVDIDPGAVEIAKLRLWLSLVVDEENIKQIKPLPNLDYKIVCGNSLLGVEKNLFNNQLFAELERLKPLLFNETNPTRKQNYKQRIDELISQITNGHKEFDFEVYFSEVFHEKKGFDVVIANPPYVRQEILGNDFKKLMKKNFPEVANGTADLYVYFFAVAFKLFKSKGTITFITPNKYLKTKYGLELRNTLRKYQVDKIIDFFELPVFEAANDTAISIIRNEHEVQTTKYFPVRSLSNLDLNILTQGNYLTSQKNNTEWIFIDNVQNQILKKFYQNSISLKDFTRDKIYYGIKTGLNKAFVLSKESAKELLQTESKEVIKRYAQSTAIKKWGITDKEKYFLAAGYGIDIPKKYPSAYKFLKQFEESLKKRLDKGRNWWNLRPCKYYNEFEKPKIIYMHTAKNHEFYLDNEGYYINNSCYMIVCDNEFLLCFLNSKLFKWFKRLKFVAYGDAGKGGRCKLDYNKMVTVPMKKITVDQQQPFITLVDRILAITKDEDYLQNPQKQAHLKALEREIDQMVYQLYGLTEEEIQIVERDE